MPPADAGGKQVPPLGLTPSVGMARMKGAEALGRDDTALVVAPWGEGLTSSPRNGKQIPRCARDDNLPGLSRFRGLVTQSKKASFTPGELARPSGAVLVWLSRAASVAEVVLRITTHQLALMATHGAFHLGRSFDGFDLGLSHRGHP